MAVALNYSAKHLGWHAVPVVLVMAILATGVSLALSHYDQPPSAIGRGLTTQVTPNQPAQQANQIGAQAATAGQAANLTLSFH